MLFTTSTRNLGRKLTSTSFSHSPRQRISQPVSLIPFISFSDIKRPVSLEKRFKKEGSVFRDWKEDTSITLSQAMEHDLSLWKIPRFVKEDSDVTSLR